MRTQAIALVLSFMIAGCEAGPGGPALTLNVTGPTDQAPAAPTDPATGPGTGSGGTQDLNRSVLLPWVVSDNSYSVDLTRAVTFEADGSFVSSWSPTFKFSPTNTTIWCGTGVTVMGNTDSGTLSITRSRSITGSQSATDRYCTPLLGTYAYTHLTADHIELCRTDNNACIAWVTP